MPRYKPVDPGAMFVPVVLEDQIQPGSFEFALDKLVWPKRVLPLRAGYGERSTARKRLLRDIRL